MFTAWRGVFVVLAADRRGCSRAATCGLPETLPASGGGRRRARDRRDVRAAARDRAFFGHALAFGLAFAAMFAYIAGSPFVLQDVYGTSPQTFSLVLRRQRARPRRRSPSSAAGSSGGSARAACSAIGLAMGATGGIAVLCVVATLAGSASAPAAGAVRHGLQPRPGLAQRRRARAGRPPRGRGQRVGAARRPAVRRRRGGGAARRASPARTPRCRWRSSSPRSASARWRRSR